MCGIAALLGDGWPEADLLRMVGVQDHRGPDDRGIRMDPSGRAALGHNRLSILDLSPAGRQPMCDATGQLWIVFNGEIYNYLELRRELAGYPFRTGTDTEVILAAYRRWGEDCLHRLQGMFAFVLWDQDRQRAFAARDRFGVKPLYYAGLPAGIAVASEIKALHAAGVPREEDTATWATFLAHGYYDHSPATFWRGVLALPAGCKLAWENGRLETRRWYDLAAAVREIDTRPPVEVCSEYRTLLAGSVRLRFRSDVPVGINLSGGLDSSLLLGLVQQVQGSGSEITAFTFATGHPEYDELPWVRRMLARTKHPSAVCRLDPQDVPDLALSVQHHQDEPFGGLPTLAYARLFEYARREGTVVLLDGQGLDEQWAGYDYYALPGEGTVQGTREPAVRPQCLSPELLRESQPVPPVAIFPDRLRNLQYRDILYSKIPRALRFNDRVSMRSGCELREPFLDHRLVELALRQPGERKISGGIHKRMLREIARELVPGGLVEAPKRPLQTPQREWLRGPLRDWANDCIEAALRTRPEWFQPESVRSEWRRFSAGESDNSFYVWQWISAGLMHAGMGVAQHA